MSAVPQLFEAHPINSRMEEINSRQNAAPVQLGNVGQTLAPIIPAASLPMVSTAPATAQDRAMLDTSALMPKPAQLGEMPAAGNAAASAPALNTVQPGTAAAGVPADQAVSAADKQATINPTVQYYQDLLKNYENPWYKQHPILTRVVGAATYGLPGLLAGPQIAQQLVDANKAKAVQGLQQAQQADTANTLFRGGYNKVADALGMERMPESGALPTDTWLKILPMVGQSQAFADIADAQARNRQIDAENQMIAHAKIQYRAKAAAGQLTDAEKKQGEPQFMKPIPMPVSANPYLDMKDLSGAMSADASSATAGEKSGADAVSNYTTEKEAEARIAEQKQASADKLQEQREWHQTLGPILQQKTDQQGQHYTDENTHWGNIDSSKQGTVQGRMAGLVQDAVGKAKVSLEKVRGLRSELENMASEGMKSGKDVSKDPNFVRKQADYRQAQAEYNNDYSKVNSLKNRYDQLFPQKQEAAPPSTAAPIVAPTGQTLHQSVPSVKRKGNASTLNLFSRLGG